MSLIIVRDYTLRVSFQKYSQRLEGICEMVFIPNLGAFHKLIIEASQNKREVHWEILSMLVIFMH